jgi:hypothetical protein
MTASAGDSLGHAFPSELFWAAALFYAHSSAAVKLPAASRTSGGWLVAPAEVGSEDPHTPAQVLPDGPVAEAGGRVVTLDAPAEIGPAGGVTPAALESNGRSGSPGGYRGVGIYLSSSTRPESSEYTAGWTPSCPAETASLTIALRSSIDFATAPAFAPTTAST